MFLGAATVLGRSQHVGIDLLVLLMPKRWQPTISGIAVWVTVAVSAMLVWSIVALMDDTAGQTTPTGLPQWVFLAPLLVGAGAMTIFALLNALALDSVARWHRFDLFKPVIASINGVCLGVDGSKGCGAWSARAQSVTRS